MKLTKKQYSQHIAEIGEIREQREKKQTNKKTFLKKEILDPHIPKLKKPHQHLGQT